MLPSTHHHAYQTLQQQITQLLDRLTTMEPAVIAQALLALQQFFQTEILSLDDRDLEPSIQQIVQSYQVEMHKQLRLLQTDIQFLQAARQPETIARRQAQVRDRLLTLIRYCEVVLEQ